MERSVKGREGRRWRRAAACGWRRRGVNRRPRGARAGGAPGRAEVAVGAAARPALQPQGVLSWALQRHGAGRAAGAWTAGQTEAEGQEVQGCGDSSRGPTRKGLEEAAACWATSVPGRISGLSAAAPSPPLPRCLGRSGRWRPSPGTDEEQGREGARPAWDGSPRPTLASCGTSVQHTHTHTEAGPPLTPQTPRSPTHTPGTPLDPPCAPGLARGRPGPPAGGGAGSLGHLCVRTLPGPPPGKAPAAPDPACSRQELVNLFFQQPVSRSACPGAGQCPGTHRPNGKGGGGVSTVPAPVRGCHLLPLQRVRGAALGEPRPKPSQNLCRARLPGLHAPRTAGGAGPAAPS